MNFPSSHHLLLPAVRLLLAGVITLIAGAGAGAHAMSYRQLQALSSGQLIDKAEKFRDAEENLDSAMLCYSIVYDRYRPTGSRQDHEYCMKAYFGSFLINAFQFFNYKEALEFLSMAERIATAHHLDSSELEFGYGVLYAIMGTYTNDDKKRLALDKKSNAHLKRAMRLAVKEKNWSIFFSAFNNFTYALTTGEDPSMMQEEVKMLHQVPDEESFQRRLSEFNYEGSLSFYHNDFPRAEAAYRRMVAAIPETTVKFRRYQILANSGVARSLLEQGRPRDALNLLEKVDSLCIRHKTLDMRLATTWAKMECYKKLGNRDSANSCFERYLEIKDTILSARLYSRVEEIKFAQERENILQEINEYHYRSRLQAWALGVAALIIAVVCVFLYLLWRNNRRLRFRGKRLYEQTQQLLAVQEKLQAPLPHAVPPQDGKPEAPVPQENTKYQGSSLTEPMKDEIAASVQRVMAGNQEIFSPDFSLNRLAELAGSKPKYVSQVINERFGYNFWSLINEARIREACRRFDDPVKYGRYSTDGIAESVGFNSRSSFSAAFKKFTGLGVGEYRKIASRNNTHN